MFDDVRTRGLRSSTAGVAMLLLATLLAACSSGASTGSGNASSGSSGTPSDTVAAGNTTAPDGPIKLTVYGLDLSQLVQAGLVPDLGDTEAQFKTMAKIVNDEKLAGNRQFEVTYHKLPAIPTTDTLRAACLQGVEDKPFVVLLASIQGDALGECLAGQHHLFMLGNVGYTGALEQEAKGLLMTGFANNAMGIDTQMKAWVDVADQRGWLKGKKIGLVYEDADPSLVESFKSVFIPEVKAKGYTLTDTFALPCTDGQCSQEDVAAQKMKDEGIDVVFNGAETTDGVALVTAAQKIGWHPDWIVNRNNTTDTIAGFYKSVGDYYDGAHGVSTSWPDSTFSPETKECNDKAAQNGLNYKPDENAYAAFGAYCIMVETLAKAIASVSGPLTYNALSKALIALKTVPSNSGPAGSWAPGKLNSADNVYSVKYDKTANDGQGGFVPDPNPIVPIKVTG